MSNNLPNSSLWTADIVSSPLNAVKIIHGSLLHFSSAANFAGSTHLMGKVCAGPGCRLITRSCRRGAVAVSGREQPTYFPTAATFYTQNKWRVVIALVSHISAHNSPSATFEKLSPLQKISALLVNLALHSFMESHMPK